MLGMAIGLGANLLGGLIKTRGESQRRKKIRAERLAALKPLEATLAQGQYGLSSSEGAIQRQVTQQTLGDLSSRGILDSNVAPAQVAQAVAPIQMEHDQRNQVLAQHIAASKEAIASDTAAPGYGEVFGDALGDVGGFMALLEGRSAEKRRRAQEHDYLLETLGLLRPHQQDMMGPPAPAPGATTPIANPESDENQYDRFRYPTRGAR